MNIKQTIRESLSWTEIMLVTFLLTMTAQSAWAQEPTGSFPTSSGGSGTSDDPYKISSTADLDQLADDVYNGTEYYGVYFIVTQDITYTHKADGEEGADTENNYTAIGNSDFYFQGHFDGKGKTISGIRIYKDDLGYQGLFARIMAPAVVENVTLTDTRIAAYSNVGGIVGSNDGGQVINCHVTNTVEIQANENEGSCFGSIAGYNEGTLENNFVIGATIPAADDKSHGAIVGKNDNGTLKNNYYANCTVAGVENATGMGVGIDSNDQPVGDVAANDGALSVYKIILAEGVKDVTIDDEAKAYSYDSKDYYAPGTTVKLTYSGTSAVGYQFNGINAGEGVTGTLNENDYTITMPARDVTVASVDMKAITYTITYAGVDEATNYVGAVKEYTVETETFRLQEPVREGYMFIGWTFEGQETPQLEVAIAKGSTGDKTFTANWRSMEEPNTALVNIEASVAIGEMTYYEPTKLTMDMIKETIEVPIAMSAEASNRMDVSEGSVKFSKGPSTTIAVRELVYGGIMSLHFKGGIEVPGVKVEPIRVTHSTRGDDDTSSDGMIKLVSGAEYKVLTDGDLILTLVLEEEEAILEGLSVTVPGDINGDKVVNVADIVKAINDGKSQDDIDEVVKIIISSRYSTSGRR